MKLLILIFVLAIIIFVLDLMVPLGVAWGVPYILIILISYKLKNSKAIPSAAILGSFLTILGFFFSPSGGELWKVVSNRLLALFAIWSVAYACMRNKKEEEKVYLLTETINQSPNPVLITDKTGEIEYVNEAFVKRSGYSQEEVLGQNPRILKSGKHSPDFYHNLWSTILSGKIWEGDIYNKRKDGSLYWEHLMISPLRDSSRVISHFYSLRLTDKQRELAQNEVNRLTHTLDQVPQAVLMTNLEGIIIYANPAFENITGYPVSEALGMNPSILKSGKQTPEFYQRLWTTINTGKHWRGEFHNKKKNGEHYWETAVISPVHDMDGKITHFIAIRDDITQGKKKELKLQKAERQLITAEKLAGIGQLAAGVSHEILNPVNIISVHNQMLKKKTPDDPKLQEFCSKVNFEVDRIKKIVNSLLAFSRTPNEDIQKGFVREEIEKVLTLVEQEYKSDNIEIVREWCDKRVELLYDPDMIRQVFLNLVNNAKYAMPKGGTITVGCRTIEKNNKDYLQLLFSDTGTGMNKKEIAKIFDPFFTTKPEGVGTGMGLSVVHGIITDNGGDIEVESEEGKGTTFKINLPAV